jgi:hypothetical protein
VDAAGTPVVGLLLIYVQEGTLIVHLDGNVHLFNEGEFCLLQPNDLHVLEGKTKIAHAQELLRSSAFTADEIEGFSELFGQSLLIKSEILLRIVVRDSLDYAAEELEVIRSLAVLHPLTDHVT